MTSVALAVAPAVEAGGVWAPPDQVEIDTLAVSLLDHPQVVAARSEAVSRFEACPQSQAADAPATLAAAVEGLLFSCLQIAANDNPTEPRVVWTVRLPYTLAGQTIPDSHYGADSPDRVYRVIGVNPAHRYEIRGRRHPTHPSADDLSFEPFPAPGLYGRPMAALSRHQFDIDADGAFCVTADGSEAAGRRNHLHMPPSTRTILVRDTLLDWSQQVPNELEVRHVDGPEVPARSPDQVAQEGAEIFLESVDRTIGLVQKCLLEMPTNALIAFERPVEWGLEGGLFAFNAFELGEDEAILYTIDPLAAGYLNIAACDPWASSVPYDSRCSSLNNLQAQADADGTYTFVLSAKDPGVHNWLDTGGLRTGSVVARWEWFSQPPPATPDTDGSDEQSVEWAPGARIVPQAVPDVRVVKLAEVASAVPAGQAQVTPEQRKQLLAARAAGYRVRVAGEVVDVKGDKP